MILSLSKTLAHYLVQGLGRECTSLGFPLLVDRSINDGYIQQAEGLCRHHVGGRPEA